MRAITQFFGEAWTDIRAGQNVGVYVTIVGAIVLAALSAIGLAGDTAVRSITLATLAIVAAELLALRKHQGSGRRIQSERDVDRAVLSRASTIDWMSYSLSRTFPGYFHEIREFLGRGGTLRLLLINPDGVVPGTLARLNRNSAESLVQSQDYVEDVRVTLRKVREYREAEPGCKIHVRFIQGQPPYKVLIVDRAKPTGILQLKLIVASFLVPSPTMMIECGQDPVWFRFFADEFERYWATADPEPEQARPLAH